MINFDSFFIKDLSLSGKHTLSPSRALAAKHLLLPSARCTYLACLPRALLALPTLCLPNSSAIFS